MEEHRKAFEAWFEKNYFPLSLNDHPGRWSGSADAIKSWEQNPYSHPFAAGAWEGWQAAIKYMLEASPQPNQGVK